jgi:flagellar biogenesis protein FliO
MSDWVGVLASMLLSLLAVVVPLVFAWWLVARGVRKRRGKMPR